ncbi:hypothetical protein METBIDRAFT_44367 [Metschnikowia bicuspidata var. bicuspidata NRRL YB-4993]|uniref:ARM repeat-containing protein n=1 Tax=Metschnikowia bicuspidata var. bicuspidata NRRL YB-4993 TaxID=869754 RepID=A0A1A0H9X9_9ASCO|nr:hypothetical protein METBIDRAFT_44367 [Metschnikowia bicuspidata var. bicuspidata NRRL YB-4993]OBA20821.1 hypothetical protein METBIDRAFT_44367 [Metschnikowia bicuspidata var. bicuspidata NRRL YB-4993]
MCPPGHGANFSDTRPGHRSAERADKIAGLGILSIDPALARQRAYTIDSLNISPIENSGLARQLPDLGETAAAGPGSRNEPTADPEHTMNLEKATWEFSDILQSISGKDRDDLPGLLEKCNRLVPLLAIHPSLKQEVVIENVMFKVQFMLYDSRAQARAAAYRVLRHALATPDALLHLVRLKLLIFIIVSLLTPTPLVEKEQALKLVREFVNIPGGVNYLSVGVVKALVAYVEHESDDTQHAGSEEWGSHESEAFMRMCIETISEIAVLNPDIVFHGGGLRLLISLTINGATDISVSCLPMLLTLLDMPHSRLFLRNGADLDCLMSVFTLFDDDDAQGKALHLKKYHTKALKMSFVLSCFLKTWLGLICFSRDNFDPVRMLLSNLRKRNSRLCSILLDLLLDVLRIKSLPWLEDSAVGDLLALAQMPHSNASSPKSTPVVSFEFQEMDPRSFEHGVISHYQGLLSKVLINCGLVPLLFNIVNEDRDTANTTKATTLLTNILDLCSKYLPLEFYSTHILQAYTTNLSLASLSKIEAATRMRQRPNTTKKTADVRLAMRDLVQKLRINMKDDSFKALIAGSKLLTMKEFDDWNWSLLLQIFQGPLRLSSRFCELQEKYPKFLKTMLSFLRPFKYRFSSLPVSASSKYPKIRKPKQIMLVACQLIEALLNTEEGSKVLATNKLMPQLAEIFAQVDPYSGISSADPILAKRRLEYSLSVGYVKIVGVMSAHPRGIEILGQWQLFHMMSNIIDSSIKDEANNFLIFNILQNLNYTRKGHARLILAKALSISNWKVKVYALENVFPLLCALEGCEQLYVLSLVNLLHDENDSVTSMSVEYLYEYFIVKNKRELIDVLVECKPSIMVLEQSEHGHVLLLTFCTTSKGFKYLEENGYIEEKFTQSLEQLKGLDFLTAVEDSLRHLLFPYVSSFSEAKVRVGPSLHHFFHYLLATEEGFTYFNSRRSYIDEAVANIRSLCQLLNIVKGIDDAHEYDGGRTSTHDDEYLLKRLKQYIWMVGEIASSNYGIQILEPVYSSTPGGAHIAETLSLIFEEASHWQLRGLAFFQLGKMAGTVEGVEILDDLQWISFDSGEKFNVSLAYPKFMQGEGFTKVEILNPYKDVSYYSLFGNDTEMHVSGNLDLEDEIVIESYEEIDDKILTLFNYLSSVLGRIERKATKELLRIKTESPQVFSNTNLFLKTIRLVDKGKFKYRTRMFIFDLFHPMKILEGLVKKDRKTSSVKRLAV